MLTQSGSDDIKIQVKKDKKKASWKRPSESKLTFN